MDLYLPIAERSVDAFLILGLGGAVGFLSGIFGIGGGFLMTPLLILLGMPPAVAVGTQAPQVLASSISGMLVQLRRRAVDTRVGWVLVAGGAVGSVIGTLLFRLLSSLGHIDLFISLSYVIFLGSIGGLMLTESLRSILKSRRSGRPRRLHQHYWVHGLPLKMRFPESRLYISLLVPMTVGAFGGLLSAVLGIGGGFVMIPLMIYLIGMPTSVVVGTSLFQIAFVAGITTLLQAILNQTVDIVLALLLIAGGVVGAQFGSRAGTRLKAEQLRLLLAILVLGVCAKLAFDLVVTPVDPFTVRETPVGLGMRSVVQSSLIA